SVVDTIHMIHTIYRLHSTRARKTTTRMHVHPQPGAGEASHRRSRTRAAHTATHRLMFRASTSAKACDSDPLTLDPSPSRERGMRMGAPRPHLISELEG